MMIKVESNKNMLNMNDRKMNDMNK